MSLFQAILIGFVYWVAKSNFLTAFETVYRPLVGGWLVGAILGDPATGAIIGANINLIYIGFIGAGGSTPGDPALAGVLGTAIAISSGLDTDAALALASTLGIIGSVVWVGSLTINSSFVHMAEKMVNNGQENKLWIPGFVMPMLVRVVLCWIPVTLACYFGTEFVAKLVAVLGGKVIGALSTVGGMLPAVGIAMLLQSIFKDDARVFLFAGFAMVVFLNLSTVGVAVFAFIISIIYAQAKSSNQGGTE